MIAIASTTTTTIPSSARTSEAARVVSAALLPTEMSSTTRTTVWIAIPPRMLPIAIPRSCERAAEVVIAISAERLAQAEPHVEDVGRAREVDAGDPDRAGRRREDQDVRGEAQAREHGRVLLGTSAVAP